MKKNVLIVGRDPQDARKMKALADSLRKGPEKAMATLADGRKLNFDDLRGHNYDRIHCIGGTADRAREALSNFHDMVIASHSELVQRKLAAGQPEWNPPEIVDEDAARAKPSEPPKRRPGRPRKTQGH